MGPHPGPPHLPTRAHQRARVGECGRGKGGSPLEASLPCPVMCRCTLNGRGQQGDDRSLITSEREREVPRGRTQKSIEKQLLSTKYRRHLTHPSHGQVMLVKRQAREIDEAGRDWKLVSRYLEGLAHR